MADEKQALGYKERIASLTTQFRQNKPLMGILSPEQCKQEIQRIGVLFLDLADKQPDKIGQFKSDLEDWNSNGWHSAEYGKNPYRHVHDLQRSCELTYKRVEHAESEKKQISRADWNERLRYWFFRVFTTFSIFVTLAFSYAYAMGQLNIRLPASGFLKSAIVDAYRLDERYAAKPTTTSVNFKVEGGKQIIIPDGYKVILVPLESEDTEAPERPEPQVASKQGETRQVAQTDQ